jgi:uncharacterized protein
MNPVVHFEMPYKDAKRVANFYQSAFDWQTEISGAEMGHYVLATTAESDKTGRPTQPGAINGGFYELKPDRPAQHTSVVIAVGDIRQSMQRVSGAGGKVLGDPMEIPGIGHYVSFTDTEGNRVGMLQPLPR